MSRDNLFHFFESIGLLIIVHKDKIEKDSSISFVEELSINPLLETCRFVLIDTRNARVFMEHEDIEEISTKLYELLSQTKIEKLALIINRPSQEAKAVEFVHNFKQSSKYQLFSSIEPAIHWFKIPISRQEQIEIKLDYLYNFC